MIHVVEAAAPNDFDETVRRPGERTLLELIGDPRAPKRPGPKRKPVAARIEDIPVKELEKDQNAHWRRALPALRAAYHDICAYLGMKIHPATGLATVDHFVPKSRDRRRAYDWSNFRLAAHQVNSDKGEQDVIDPFEVVDGWFVLKISNFSVAANPSIEPGVIRDKIESTIRALKLNDPTYCASRRAYHDRYHGLPEGREPLPYHWLEEECPFVARELRRQGRLRPGDSTDTRGG